MDAFQSYREKHGFGKAKKHFHKKLGIKRIRQAKPRRGIVASKCRRHKVWHVCLQMKILQSHPHRPPRFSSAMCSDG